MNSSVTEGAETKQVQLRIAWPKQQLSILIKPGPPQMTPPLSSCQPLHSPLFPSPTISFFSVSIVFPSFITHNCHLSITLFTAQACQGHNCPAPRPISTQNPLRLPILFLSSSTNSIHPVTQPAKYSQTACLFHLSSSQGSTATRSLWTWDHHLGDASPVWVEAHRGRRKAIMRPLSISAEANSRWYIYFFYFSHLKAQTAHTPLLSTISGIT